MSELQPSQNQSKQPDSPGRFQLWIQSVNLKQALIWTLCSIAVMAAIFWFSSRNAKQSELQSNFFAVFLAHITNIKLEQASFLVRKAAHFTIYLILGFCVLRAAKAWQTPRRYIFAAAWIFCIIYAGSDEFHQLFSDGRAGQIRDVILDSCGSFVGVFISQLLLSYK